ncbi:DUF4307 domain-containing protein [Solwaraspora sp. WMMD406]|uniref:DUF4307 domain-containing protein n=1 Tax=Solwaraspora sp. WMMD406 TaxID=3016095 RepID=UPI002417F1A9|nr:DUF4307 domain-containing protein [Solwaraspora sp. WMMD406]MDG4763854.1 DUF4307 domain-containing protein [Solwaraspora sp. WMMD406]
MTDTSATTTPTTPVFPPSSTTAPVFPAGRYGRRRAPRRRRPWVTALLATVAVLAATAVAARLYTLYGDPAYDPEVITYTDVTEEQILIDFAVTVPPGGSAVCLVRARSRDGAEVGRAEVTVAAQPGERLVRTTYRLETDSRAFLGEVPRCRPAD